VDTPLEYVPTIKSIGDKPLNSPVSKRSRKLSNVARDGTRMGGIVGDHVLMGFPGSTQAG
jgi:hypothetical protein